MAINLPVCDSCCFCVDLRTGALIIGYLKLVTQGLTLIFSVILLAAGITLAGDPEHRDEGYMLLMFSILMLTLAIPIYCFTIFLVYGIHIGEPEYVLAYLVCAVCLIIASLTSFLISVFVQSLDAILMEIILYSFEIYLLLIIRSYYLRMKSEGP